MKKVTIASALFFCLCIMVFARNSDAAYYKYIDKDGVVCFADDLQVVPAQYRAKAVIVETQAQDEERKPAGPAIVKIEPARAAADAERETADIEREAADTKQEVKGQRPLSTRLMISGAIVLGAHLIFVVISCQLRSKEDKKVLSLVRGSLMAVVLLYLVVAHAGDVMIIFGMAGKTVEEVQQQSAEKARKAAQAMKALDAAFEEAQKAQRAQTTTGQAPDND